MGASAWMAAERSTWPLATCSTVTVYRSERSSSRPATSATAGSEEPAASVCLVRAAVAWAAVDCRSSMLLR